MLWNFSWNRPISKGEFEDFKEELECMSPGISRSIRNLEPARMINDMFEPSIITDIQELITSQNLGIIIKWGKDGLGLIVRSK